MIHALYLCTAFAAAILLALAARGFVGMALRRDGSTVHHLSAGLLLIIGCAALRSAYWDVLPWVIGPVNWELWHASVGMAWPNLFFALLWVAGALHLLRLLYLLIPEHERAQYGLLTAPFYPRGSQSIVLGIWRKRGRGRS